LSVGTDQREVLEILHRLVIAAGECHQHADFAGFAAELAQAIIREGDMVPVSGANPLPQALVLTAIVIAFSIFAFLLVLAYRAYQELDSDHTDSMRLAEPKGEGLPPLRY
jgi:multicomponent Na+:H+ antiporter subunit C